MNEQYFNIGVVEAWQYGYGNKGSVMLFGCRLCGTAVWDTELHTRECNEQ